MRKCIWLAFLLTIGVLIMLKPVSAIIKDSTENIIYRGNVVTGVVAVDNGNKSYDVYIGESAEAYPSIFTLSRNPDLAVGDKVRILYEEGIKEKPIILPPTQVAAPEPSITQYLYTLEIATSPLRFYLVQRSLSDLSIISSVAVDANLADQIAGNFAFDSSGNWFIRGHSTNLIYKYNKSGTKLDSLDTSVFWPSSNDYTIREYSGCGVIGNYVYFASNYNDGFIRAYIDLNTATRIEFTSNINYGFGSDGTYLYCTGVDLDGDGANAKYDSNGGLIWSKKHPVSAWGHKAAASSAGFAIQGWLGSGGNDFIRIYDRNGNLLKQIDLSKNYGFGASGLQMDSQGNVYFMSDMEYIKKYDSNGNELANCTYDTGNSWIGAMAISD